MAKRIPKTLAFELIGFVKKLQVNANFWDKGAISAFEFAKQMSSPNLAKKNPSYECIMVREPDPEYIPKMKVEYVDGSILEMETNQHTAAGLRALFYEKAEDAEEVMSLKGGAPMAATPSSKGSKGGKK